MTTASLNGVALSTIDGVELLRVRRPFPTPRHKVVEIPGRAGSVIFPEEPGDRIVTLELHLLADDYAARRSAVEELAGWAYVGAVSGLVIDDQADRYEEAILDAVVDPDEWLHAATIVLPFRCSAYALGVTLSTETLTANPPTDSGDFTIPDSAEVRPVIQITANGGTLNSFTLLLNGYSLSWVGAVSSGGTVTVNTISETITAGASTDVNLTGAYNTGDVRMTDASGFFPLLVPGLNEWGFSYSGTATSVTIEIEWRERFLT